MCTASASTAIEFATMPTTTSTTVNAATSASATASRRRSPASRCVWPCVGSVLVETRAGDEVREALLVHVRDRPRQQPDDRLGVGAVEDAPDRLVAGGHR